MRASHVLICILSMIEIGVLHICVTTIFCSVPRYVSQSYLGANLTDQDYHQHSIVTRTDLAGLRDTKLLLMHGVLDQEVLLDNTLELAEALIRQNIMFQQKVIFSSQWILKRSRR